MTHPARALWMAMEPIHAVSYFAPAALDAHRDAGCKGFWMGYFAARAAPLGAVSPDVVEATFAGFARPLIDRALPDAWSFVTPDEMLDARAEGAAAALRWAVPDIAETARRAVPLLEQVVAAASPTGRPLGAANRGLPVRRDPVERLWQATSTLRELRGDAHVAALVAHGLDGVAANVLRTVGDDTDRELICAARGIGPELWESHRTRLVARGLVDDHGRTPQGAGLLDDVERATDEAAIPAYDDGLTTDGVELLGAVLRPAAAAVLDTGLLPFPNPIGLPDVRSAATGGG